MADDIDDTRSTVSLCLLSRVDNCHRCVHVSSIWSCLEMSHLVGKPTMWFPTRSDTNRPVQAQKRARSLKFRIYIEEELYYPSSENNGADQLRGSDLRLCFRVGRLLVFP